jgi:hypothetical protein
MKSVGGIFVTLALVAALYGAEDVVTAAHGTVEKVDSGTKTVVVKTDDGVDHSFHIVDRTTVHGAKDSFQGLKGGSEVVVHYTKTGTDETAVEIDKVGRGGLRTADGTVKEFDRGGKKLVVDTGHGTEETFRLTDHASKDAGKDIAKGSEKGSKVTIYYTEDAGKKIAHFFKAI